MNWQDERKMEKQRLRDLEIESQRDLENLRKIVAEEFASVQVQIQNLITEMENIKRLVDAQKTKGHWWNFIFLKRINEND